MDITSSLHLGFVVILILFLLSHITAILQVVGSWITWCKDIRYLYSLPSPPGRWLSGNALDLDHSWKSLQYMLENHKKYPNWCVYWIGPLIPWVFTANVKIMSTLLQQSGGTGLVLSSGGKWKRHRKMLTPAFHFDMLKQYIPVYNEVSHKLLDIWGEYADRGESIEITKYLVSYTLDVLLRCVYSTNSNCLENKDMTPFLKGNRELARLFIKRIYNPLLIYDWIYFKTADGRKFLHHCEVVQKYSEDVILERREELLKTSSGLRQKRKYQDLLDILLSTRDENGEGLTDTEIREETVTFMTAGHDTNASALGWTLYCLAMYKEHQELCREEIREVLTGRDTDDIIWEDLSKLSYVTMCIKEAMRLYPIAPYVAKLSSEDIMANGQKIPKGTWLGVGIHAMQRDPSVWNDPERFDPLRFNTENSKKMDPFTFLAFSAGPRNCIGQRFAMQEMKVTVAHVVNRFLLEVDTTHTVEPYFHTILKAKTGIKLKLSFAPM
ncbi:cytochrome P450 4F6-like isoform X2 [Dysidea avara]|uniref:cytochrome P450 4F6-like isoform X2 n=1 Tax=Dysidea avara TaxID=196820 RepID=UPI003321CA28